jgi:hypothetical protein
MHFGMLSTGKKLTNVIKKQNKQKAPKIGAFFVCVKSNFWMENIRSSVLLYTPL